MLIPAVVFFISGFAALLYQVIWQRMLVIFSGADVYSATLIVAAFMAGMGAGNLVGGQIADRTSRRACLMLFGVAELAIGVFGLLSRAVYYDFLYQRLGHLPIPPGVTAAILFVSLLWPTFFMGASLPLLARALTDTIERAATTIGVLYSLNTLGAAVGALVSTWVLLPQLGLEGSLRVGATLNIACAAVLLPAVLVFRTSGAVAPTSTRTAPSGGAAGAAPAEGATFGFWGWASIAAFSGLLALSLEIAWFRVFGVMMKATAFTFGTLLAVYLVGIGLGALAGSIMAPRIRRPAVTFLTLQAAVALSAAALLTVFIRRVDNTPWLWTYLGRYEPLDLREAVNSLAALVTGVAWVGPDSALLPWTFLEVYFCVPALLVLPPTFLMGYSFPVLQRVVQTDLARIGRRVGLVLLANVLGSMAGTMLTGWVFLDLIGTAGTLRLLVASSSLFAILALALARSGAPVRLLGRGVPTRYAAVLATLLVFGPVLVLMPDAATLWTRLHGTTPDRALIGEDSSGLSLIKTEPRDTIVFVNGIGQSTLPYGDIHTALGAIPAFVHPAPRSAAIIGLGSGDTVHAVAGRQGIERITCVEIVRPQLGTLRELSKLRPFDGLLALLGNRRIEQVYGDGRIYLMRSGATYDIIEADALRPSSAYSGNLYSEEYFRLVRDHLTPNGLAATWAPTQRVYNSFIRVFPHVVSVKGILLGSRANIEIDRQVIATRLADSRAREYYGSDIEALMASFLAEPARYGPDFPRDTLTDFNTDLFPRDEYDLSAPRR